MTPEERAALARIIEEQRNVLFGASAVISVCAHACLDDCMDGDELSEALRVAQQMVDRVKAKLEPYTREASALQA
jgi:hypothetical protein